jgi:scyllo-inositol 2-dehydrogenase (NADP+)
LRVIRIGLIGYGLAGSVFHAPLIRSVPQLRLASVATSRREQAARDLPGVAVISEAGDLLGDPAIDVVIVASPSPTHFDLARAALLAGKHVVVDKPLASTAGEADELIALADRQGLVLSVFQNRRWDGDYLTVRHAIAEGWLGRVVYYEAHFDRFRPRIKAGWREEPGPGTGILFDLGAHLIDQALQLFGMPHAVTADIIAQRAGATVEDYFHLVLDYGQRRAVLHSATLVPGPGPRFVVHGDGGSFLKYGMDGQEDALRQGRRPGDPNWAIDAPGNDGELTSADGTRRRVETLRGAYQHYYQALAACLATGAPIPVDPRDARDGLIVMEAAMRSAAERRTISCGRERHPPR